MPVAHTRYGDIQYSDSGDSPSTTGLPLVLLLPPSTGPVGRDEFTDALSRNHRVLQPVQRGVSGGLPVEDTLSIETLAGDLLAFLETIGLDGVDLACHSTGCGIGLSAIAQDPARVNKLILISPWSHADVHLESMQGIRKAAARSFDARTWAIFNASLLFPPAYRREHGDAFLKMTLDAVAPNAEDFAARLDAILAFDARQVLDAVTAPTLIINAMDDQLMPVWFGDEMAARIANSRYDTLPDGGHMLTETRARTLCKLMLEFLA